MSLDAERALHARGFTWLALFCVIQSALGRQEVRTPARTLLQRFAADLGEKLLEWEVLSDEELAVLLELGRPPLECENCRRWKAQQGSSPKS
jgi:hypothetical protein